MCLLKVIKEIFFFEANEVPLNYERSEGPNCGLGHSNQELSVKQLPCSYLVTMPHSTESEVTRVQLLAVNG